MATYKLFEMNVMMNNQRNKDCNPSSAGIGGIVPSNNYLNTPFLLHGESTTKVPPSIDTPFAPNRDLFNQNLDVQVQGAGRDVNDANAKNITERFTFAANGANLGANATNSHFDVSNKQPDWSNNNTSNASHPNHSSNDVGRRNDVVGRSETLPITGNSNRQPDTLFSNGGYRMDAYTSDEDRYSDIYVDGGECKTVVNAKPYYNQMDLNAGLETKSADNQQPSTGNFFMNGLTGVNGVDYAINVGSHANLANTGKMITRYKCVRSYISFL